MKTETFTTHEIFFCQWTSGAKEYYHTIEEAYEKANSHYVKPAHMSEKNYQYWLTQKFIIGKELTVTQQIDLVENKG